VCIGREDLLLRRRIDAEEPGRGHADDGERIVIDQH